MKVKLAYGRSGLTVNLPDGRTTVIAPLPMPPLPDEAASVLHALRHSIRSRPLIDLISPDDRVAIVLADARPGPNAVILPLILDELRFLPGDRLVIIDASGVGRERSSGERDDVIPADIARQVRVVRHDPLAPDHVSLGCLSTGVGIALQGDLVEATKRIVVSGIEPHALTGFTGGPLAIAPGCASSDTILDLYAPGLVADPDSTWAVTDGNPLWEHMCEAARLLEVTFSVNVTVNKRQQITNVFAGHPWQSHRVGVEFARKTAMRGVNQTFDVVVTTNAGYPQDQTLQQTLQGMAAAAQIVRAGGTIVCASECSEGIPEQGNLRKMLKQAGSGVKLLDMLQQPGFRLLDRWDAQALALIQRKANIYLKAGYLSDQQIREAILTPTANVEQCVNDELERMGPGATVGVLPEGALTVPFIQAREPLALV